MAVIYKTDKKSKRVEVYKKSSSSSIEALEELNDRQKFLASHILFREFNEIVPRGTSELHEIFSILESSDKGDITEELVRVVKEGTIEDKQWEWIQSSERTKIWFWGYFKYNCIIAGTDSIPYQQSSNDYFESAISSIYNYFRSDDYMLKPYPMDKYNKVGERAIELYKNDKLNYMIKAQELYAV
ncbi:hypothetical protein, partial [Psychrobacter sp. 1Y4]|uniref:hypothetical protein n=1 Tax=Psychrobacter sp. 1Y4 TaxID=3453575 RepID=UPI003F44F73C